MTKRSRKKKQLGSPPFVTGGGGFGYEDLVAAYILAAMLAEQPPFGEDTRNVVKVDWQTGTSGWRLDDLLVTCQNPAERRVAISCKSDSHVKGSGWPPDTVTRIWQHWLGENGDPFRRTTDLLAVVTGDLGQGVKKTWNQILSDALVGDPKRFMQQYQGARTSSKSARDIVQSLKCPDNFAGRLIDEPDQRFEVIRHMRLWGIDALANDSAAITQAAEWCRSALVSGEATQAAELFKALVSLAAERRPRSGTLTKREMIELLAKRFALKVAPSHEASWQRIHAHSAELQADVRTTINDLVSLTHAESWSAITKATSPGQVVVLEGESGSGKSALAKRLALGCQRTLWLSPSDFDHATLNAVGIQLGATVPLGTLVDEERSKDPLLVIDGAERLTATGRRAAAKLIAAATKAANPWSVIVTTQEGGVDTLLAEIGQSPVSGSAPIQSVEVRLPDEQCVEEVIKAVGVTLSAKARPSLLRVLRNLKALDWVAQAARQQDLKGFPDLVEQVWRRFVGTHNARARSEVLKTLAKEDAARVVSGVPNSVLSGVPEQQVAETLIQDGLLSARHERLYFRHDLLGDWARLLVLIEAGEHVADVLREVATSFRWAPAIRLFAEWLLQEGDIERQRLLSLVVSDPPSAASLPLLEGLFRSPDCGPVLAAILDHQASQTPGKLDTVLNTFVSVATQPAALCRMISKADPESGSIRSTFRVPIPELWPAVTQVLEKRAEQLARSAPLRLGAVMRRWLSDLPTTSRPDLLETHQACSRLAIAAARELQARDAESKYRHSEEATHAFEAALYAAQWFPDDIASIALELSTRRPEPQTVKDRAAAEQKRVSEEIKAHLAKLGPEELKRRQSISSIGPTPIPRRKPIEGGPTDRVNEEFRKAALAPGVLVRLMATRPAEAQEALMACCLEDPHDEDPLYSRHHHGNHAGAVDPMGWYPPLYLRGPWLSLLAQVPEQGLEAIMRLVAAGTSEWLRLNIPRSDHPHHDWMVRVSTIPLIVGGAERVFRGDHSVFGWYRGYGRSGNIVASALMALEFWLYGLVDGNQPIDRIVKRILESGSSVALLGVLAAVARKNHQLLDDSLLPLIQSWMVVDWDEHLAGQARMPSVDLFGLKALNNVYDDESDRWSALPHRKIVLSHLIAQKLAMGQKEIIQACEASRERWQAELDTGNCLSAETVHRYVALLNPKNLTLTQDPNGQVVFSVQWPPELQAKFDLKAQNAGASIAAFELRQVMRTLLDEPRVLSDEQIDLIWKRASSLPDPVAVDEDQANDTTIVEARAAAAAVLEGHASGWLDKHPGRRAWCERAAVDLMRRGARRDNLTGGISNFKEYGESFTGAWAIARLAADDKRELVLRAVAEAITAQEHIVTGQVLAEAIRLASKLAGELPRLFNLTWLWAALHNLPGATWQPESWEAKIASVRRQRLIDAYVKGRIPTIEVPWDDLKLRAAKATERHERRRHDREPGWGRTAEQPTSPPQLPLTWDNCHNHGFNWSVLEKVVECVPYVVRPSLGADLGPLIEFDRRLQDLTIWNLKRAPRRMHGDSSPSMLDRLVLDRMASVIAAHEDENVAMDIWRRLAPHLARHRYWVEGFFDSWFGCKRTDVERAKRFHNRWQQMIVHTATMPDWNETEGDDWYDVQQARAAILGIHDRGSKLGQLEDRPYLARMVDRYRGWAQKFAADSLRLRSLCHFLQRPGAVDLQLPALSWVRDALKSLPTFRANDKNLATEVVALCAAAWYRQPGALLADADARTALIAIVQHLSHLQVQQVQELKTDLEAGMAQNPTERVTPN